MDERNDICEHSWRPGCVRGCAAVDRASSLFASEVRVDYTSLFGGEPQVMAREELVAGWQRLLPGFTRTRHIIGLPSIIISGRTAQAAASVVAWHC